MKLNPAPPDPTQKMIFDWMPLIFTFMLASFPAGLVIYWAWNNTLSVLQQGFIMNKHGAKIELWDNVKEMFGMGKKKEEQDLSSRRMIPLLHTALVPPSRHRCCCRTRSRRGIRQRQARPQDRDPSEGAVEIRALRIPARLSPAAAARRMARPQPAPRRRRFLARPPLHRRAPNGATAGAIRNSIAAAGTPAASARAGRSTPIGPMWNCGM